MTTIHVDGDACPVRDEVYQVALRLGVKVVVVGNGARPVRLPDHPDLRLQIVADGADAADDWIAEHIGAGDVCVTAGHPARRALPGEGRPRPLPARPALDRRTTSAARWPGAR